MLSNVTKNVMRNWCYDLNETFWCGCFSLSILVTFCAKNCVHKFLCTRDTLQGGRVEDYRMMFTRHLHLLQSYIASNTLLILNWLHDVFNHLHPNISMHILLTVLYVLPYLLARRICLTIKRFFSWLSFPLFS